MTSIPPVRNVDVVEIKEHSPWAGRPRHTVVADRLGELDLSVSASSGRVGAVEASVMRLPHGAHEAVVAASEILTRAMLLPGHLDLLYAGSSQR